MYRNPCHVASSDSLASGMNSVDQAITLVITCLDVLNRIHDYSQSLSLSLWFWSVSVDEMIRISSHPKSLLDKGPRFSRSTTKPSTWWHDQTQVADQQSILLAKIQAIFKWHHVTSWRLLELVFQQQLMQRHRVNDALIILPRTVHLAFGDMELARSYGTDLSTKKNIWTYHKRS